jgi:hypothetical protein
MQKIFIVLGLAFILVGLLWPLLMRLNLGNLPGDLFFKRGNVTFYFPLITCLVISAILSIILWFLSR